MNVQNFSKLVKNDSNCLQKAKKHEKFLHNISNKFFFFQLFALKNSNIFDGFFSREAPNKASKINFFK